MNSVKVDAKDLLDAINFVNLAIERRTTIPILSLMRLTSTNGVVTLRGTNLDVETETTIAAVTVGKIDVMLPPKVVAFVLNNEAGEAFISQEDFTIRMEIGRSSMELVDPCEQMRKLRGECSEESVTPKSARIAELEAALVERDARIAELEAAIDSAEIEAGYTSDGNLWRFWRDKVFDSVGKNTELRKQLAMARNDALDWLLERMSPLTNEDAYGKAHSLISYRNGYTCALNEIRALKSEVG